MRRTVDVVVLGGGPAGCATALTLRRYGRSVAVIERSRYEHPRVGEVLPPGIQVPLARLGVWERFLQQGPRPSPGIQAAWGAPVLRARDFVFDPYGNGWHVDRRRFDAMLADAAERAGAVVLRGARVDRIQQDAAGRWRILVRGANMPDVARGHALVVDGPASVIADQVESPGTTDMIDAAYAVDATGRAARLARSAGAERWVCDRLIGVLRFLDLVPGGCCAGEHLPLDGVGRGECTVVEHLLLEDAGQERSADEHLLLEATAQGWWYSAFLPVGLVAGFMTDGDLYRQSLARGADPWLEALKCAPHTAERVGLASGRVGPESGRGQLHVLSAGSHRLSSIYGPRWVAVGDAAMAFDPLSSRGVQKALSSGLQAAEALHLALSGQQGALPAYALRAEQDFEEYLEARAAYYRLEQRWPDAPFWQRRHRWPA